MGIDAWFPTPIFHEDLEIPEAVHVQALAAVLAATDLEKLERSGRYTAADADEILHLEPGLAPLFERLDAPIRRFLYEGVRFDPERTQFYVGRCWPVVQARGGEGVWHFHVGAVVSGVFYLEAPEGSGGLEIARPLDSLLDVLPKREPSPASLDRAVYDAAKHRIVLFGSHLKHRALPSSPDLKGFRVALAFDLFATTELRGTRAGMPHAALLKRIG